MHVLIAASVIFSRNGIITGAIERECASSPYYVSTLCFNLLSQPCLGSVKQTNRVGALSRNTFNCGFFSFWLFYFRASFWD